MYYMPMQRLILMLLVCVVHVLNMHAAACVDQKIAERIEQKQKDKALMQAAKTADVPNVAVHLKRGANPNYRRSLSGETVLMAAVRARVPFERRFDIVIATRMLLEHKAHVNAIKTPYDSITALHYIVTRTDITNEIALHVIRLLLHAGANRFIAAKSTYAQLPLCEEEEGFTPCQQAANAAQLYRVVFPLLSHKLAYRAEFLKKYHVSRPLSIKVDDWLPPAEAVAYAEKSLNTLRVNDAYRKYVAQNSGRARRARRSKEQSDLFKDGW